MTGNAQNTLLQVLNLTHEKQSLANEGEMLGWSHALHKNMLRKQWRKEYRDRHPESMNRHVNTYLKVEFYV